MSTRAMHRAMACRTVLLLMLSVSGATPTLTGCGADPRTACPEADPALAAELYARGRDELASSRDGEHYRSEPFEQAMSTLRRAARAGSRDARSLYGRTRFATTYARRAPEPADRDDVVSALVALRLAGRAGDGPAASFLPTWSDDAPDRTRAPLDALPPAWLDAALERAHALERCDAGDG